MLSNLEAGVISVDSNASIALIALAKLSKVRRFVGERLPPEPSRESA
jgi:hypothetical protein